ncbi:MAG: hypothetical protein ACFFC3_14755 [Candidatus Odinarchaeota archaeon]
MVRYIKEYPEDKYIANRIKKNLNLTYNQVKIRSIIDDLDENFPDFSY